MSRVHVTMARYGQLVWELNGTTFVVLLPVDILNLVRRGKCRFLSMLLGGR
jgi:hypothetical protein